MNGFRGVCAEWAVQRLAIYHVPAVSKSGSPPRQFRGDFMQHIVILGRLVIIMIGKWSQVSKIPSLELHVLCLHTVPLYTVKEARMGWCVLSAGPRTRLPQGGIRGMLNISLITRYNNNMSTVHHPGQIHTSTPNT